MEKKRRVATSAISTVPKGKKIKVLTHRPRYIETTMVPKLAEGTSSPAEPGYLAPVSSKGESAEMPRAMGQEKAESARVPKRPAEAKKSGRRARARGVGKIAKNPEPAIRAGAVEGVQSSCNNSQEEEDC
jgi:hypothetical protein